jgi:hypothetical protein
VPATRTEVDHVIAWADGGTTDPDNLHTLCERHHHLKHEAGWSVRRSTDGTTTWISPTGRTYDLGPARYEAA